MNTTGPGAQVSLGQVVNRDGAVPSENDILQYDKKKLFTLLVGTEHRDPLDLASHVAIEARLLDKHLRGPVPSPGAELDVGGVLIRNRAGHHERRPGLNLLRLVDHQFGGHGGGLHRVSLLVHDLHDGVGVEARHQGDHQGQDPDLGQHHFS